MKICICCSLTFTNEALEVARMLESLGHEVLLPNGIINRLIEQPNFDPVQAKISTDSHHAHAERIRSADCILVCNFLKNCTPGYIGANTFAEMYFAYYLGKPIYSLFPLPDTPYINDEIYSFGVQVLNYDLSALPTSLPKEASINLPPAPVATTTPTTPTAPITPDAEPLAPELSAPKPAQTADEPIAPVLPLPPKPEPITSGSVPAPVSDIPSEPWHPWSFLKRK